MHLNFKGDKPGAHPLVFFPILIGAGACACVFTVVAFEDGIGESVELLGQSVVWLIRLAPFLTVIFGSVLLVIDRLFSR